MGALSIITAQGGYKALSAGGQRTNWLASPIPSALLLWEAYGMNYPQERPPFL